MVLINVCQRPPLIRSNKLLTERDSGFGKKITDNEYKMLNHEAS